MRPLIALLALLLLGSAAAEARSLVVYCSHDPDACELAARSFGGTDGHRYVNGVLDKFAGLVRATEIAAQRRGAATA